MLIFKELVGDLHEEAAAELISLLCSCISRWLELLLAVD